MRREDAPKRLLLLLPLLGAGSATVPYVGEAIGVELQVSSIVEVLDHVVPGLLVGVFGGAALACTAAGRREPPVWRRSRRWAYACSAACG